MIRCRGLVSTPRVTMNGVRLLLLSTYDLGRQPFGLASPAAWLREAGVDVRALDLAKQGLDEETVRWAEVAAFYLPMHTATRLALPVIQRIRTVNPGAVLCAYGLYGPPNEVLLRSRGVQHVLAGEFEADLVALARGDRLGGGGAGRPIVPRLAFRVPDRRDLPRLERYASLQLPNGDHRVVGYTEASRGCKHTCRHCPVVPIYQGQFRVVPVDVVLADIRQQVEAGAQHVTFGDPDFFNGIRHATAVVEALARECPGLTYDVTIKIEHLLRHVSELRTLHDTGCLFVTSAVESIDDRVLALLEKGHTRADFERAVGLCRTVGLALSPTFVAFHPWMTLDDYCALLDAVVNLDLVNEVSPIQFAIRLLIPEGSRLLELPDVRGLVERFDVERLAYPWQHPDPRVDGLQADVTALVGARLTGSRRATFAALRRLAYERAGHSTCHIGDAVFPPGRAEVPYLNEPWYC